MRHRLRVQDSEGTESSETSSTKTYRHPYNTRSSGCLKEKSTNSPSTAITSKYKQNRSKNYCKNYKSPMDYCYTDTSSETSWKCYFCKICKAGFYFTLIAGIIYCVYNQQKLHHEFSVLKKVYQKNNKTKLNNTGSSNNNCSKNLEIELNKTMQMFTQSQSDPVRRPDFALGTSDAKIVRVEAKSLTPPKSFLGITLCDEGSHGPSKMILPSIAPGECWAFQGQIGKAIIQLIDEVIVDAVTIEHIESVLSPSGGIDSAPKDFKIWGMQHPNGYRKFLGEFRYEKDGSRIQTFEIPNEKYFGYVEFEVASNHGNKEYTCVYRIRVHGKGKK